MKASVVLDQGMTFHGTADTGQTVQMSTSTGTGGDDDGPTPMELVLMGLGGCTGMDVVSILRKKRQQVFGFEVALQSQRAPDHPHVFTDIEINYIVRGHQVSEKAVQRAIELSRDKYCPAQIMLAHSVNITHRFEIIESGAEEASDT